MNQNQIVHQIIKDNFTCIYKGKNLNTYKHNKTGEYVTKYVDDDKYWVGTYTVNMYPLDVEKFIEKFA